MKKLLTLCLALATASLFAVTPVPFTEGVSFTTKITGTLSSALTINAESTVNVSDSVSGGGTHESSVGTALLRPGKSYTMNMAGSGTGTYQLSFTGPAGYAVYINNLPADLWEQTGLSGSFSDDFTLEIRPLSSGSGAPWGNFSGIAVGKSISWEIGLGDLRTGRTAGSISFREPDLMNSPASRDRLFYTAPANVSQIFVIKDGPSNQRLRQISTPIGFTDIVDVTGGYEFRFYTWGQVGWNGTLWTFTGSAWKTIKVESPSANQLKITETDTSGGGSVTRVSTLTGTGCLGVSGGTITTSGSNTIHTFNSSGTLTVSGSLSSVDYLVVGGGGGGGSGTGGGGGGGGSVEYQTGQSLSGGFYTVSVGAGGATDTNGGNSSFNSTTGYGGGYGAGPLGNYYASSGGSGGGGNANQIGASAGSGSNVYQGGGGDNGGTGWSGGGGGGAGGNSQNPSQGGGTYNGGNGLANSITGTSAYYGGGGGGGNGNKTGGLGGGGNGGTSGSGGSAGAANTGGGGGGSSVWGSWSGGAGGSGVVIVRYPSANAGNYTWTLQEGDGTTVRRTTKHTSSVPASGQRDDVVEVRSGGTSGTLVSKTKYHYVTQPWGAEELGSIVADPDSAALTTSYEYYSNSTALGNYRKVRSVTEPTGNWTAYEYYDDYAKRGQLYREYHPFLDTPSTVPSTLDPTSGQVIELNYDYDWTGRYRALVSRQVKINNVLTTKTTRDQDFDYSTTSPRNRFTQNDFSDASNFTQTYVQNWREDVNDADLVGQPCYLVTPNVAQTSKSFSRGTYNSSTKAFAVSSSGDHWRELKFNGSYTSAGGAEAVTSFNSQSCDSIWMLPNKSTVEVIVRIQQGFVYRTETWVYTGSGSFALLTSEDFDYDGYGHLYQRLASNGAMTTYVWQNGRLMSSTDSNGIETQCTYDELGRVATSIKKGASASGSYASQGDVTTTYTYDGADRIKQIDVTGGSLTQTTTNDYNLAGQLTQTVALGGYTTGYQYASGGRVVTTTLPGGSTKTTEVYPDGQPKSLTGTAVVAQYSSYSVNSTTGNISRQVNYGTLSSSSLSKTTLDWLGRIISETKPGWNGSDITTTRTYDTYYGYLKKVSRQGFADTLYSYDTMGNLFRECLDVGGNGAIDLASTDRITEHGWTYFTNSSNWWKRETTSVYATSGSGTATQVAKVETQISGLPSGRLSRSDSYDTFGNVTSQLVDVSRSGKTMTTTTDTPDSTTDVVQVAYNGLLMSSRDAAGHTNTFGYDALGRRTTSVDPRVGTTTTAFRSGSSEVEKIYDPKASVALAGNPSTQPTITYHYDGAGRPDVVTNALNKKTYYAYTARGEQYRVWGDATYPVEYGYDTWSHRTTMTTYRGGTSWTGTTWPSSPPTGDVTTWKFQEATGLLEYKEDANTKRVNYTYTQAGQIHTRTWARTVSSSALTTTYDYYTTTGELHTVDYSDSTPDLTFTYDRLGNVSTVIDATGTRTFNYNLAGTLEMQSEDLPSFFGSRRVTYPRAVSGVIGRPAGLQLGTSGSPTAEQSVTYGFDTYGRLNSVAGGSQTFTYGYATNSNLVSTVTNSGANYTDTRAYDPYHDWVDSRTTTISTVTKAAFAYTQDDLGRVTQVTKTGDATSDMFKRYGDGTQGLDTSYGYDDRSQITSAQTKLGGTSTVLTGRDDTYSYDNIGNRSSSSGVVHNGNAANYTSNALNQYTQRSVPGIFDVAGAAGSGATVTVAGSSTGVTHGGTYGEYFFKGHALTNTSSAAYSNLTVSDGTNSFSLPAFLPLTPEPFTYDDDGNLTRDGRWVYQYDAENRVVTMFTRGAPEDPDAGLGANSAVWNSGLLRQRVTFKYDYLGRRVQKTVLKRNTGNTAWEADTDEKFVWSGWNIIAKLDALSSNALVASYYWGLDLSGSLQGAGGVGGLLMTQEGGNSYLPIYDGNGNVNGLIKASDGSIAAAYEYDAFGQTLRESGSYAASNPFRFSTKYTDIETGLVYLGLRYYSPTLGRFINRDPFGEAGGLNLYAYCGNSGVNGYDYLGQYWVYVQLFSPIYSWIPTYNWFGQFLGWNFGIVGYNIYIIPVWIPDPKPPTTGGGNTGGNTGSGGGGDTGGGNTGGGGGDSGNPGGGGDGGGTVSPPPPVTPPRPLPTAGVNVATADMGRAGNASSQSSRMSGPATFWDTFGQAMLRSQEAEMEANMRAGQAMYAFGRAATVGTYESGVRHWQEGTTAYYQGDYLMMGLHTAASFGDFTSLGLMTQQAAKGGLTIARAGIAVERSAVSLVDDAIVAELQASGIKITPQNVVATSRNAAGQTVFLETGNASSGLAHIVQAHGADFARIGVAEADIPAVVTRAVTHGRFVGYQGARPIYQITINGQVRNIAVTVGDNGYIVGANPTSLP